VADVRPIARAIADAGADALTAVNTLAGIAVAPSRERPLLGNVYGGLSGPAIKPVALRIVYEVAQSVDIPIVAIGGVTDLADVLDYLAVGAVAVEVGTAIFADPTLPVRLIDELAAECRRRIEAYETETGKTATETLHIKGHLYFTWLWQLSQHPNLTGAIAELIGEDLFVMASRFWIKQPGDRKFVTWHQDLAYFGLDPQIMVTAWLARDRLPALHPALAPCAAEARGNLRPGQFAVARPAGRGCGRVDGRGYPAAARRDVDSPRQPAAFVGAQRLRYAADRLCADDVSGPCPFDPRPAARNIDPRQRHAWPLGP